jgi:hypothetical protein
MKPFKLISLLLIILLIIISCGEPPENTPEVNILELIQDLLNKMNEIKNNDKETLKFFKYITTTFQAIIAFRKDTTINIKSENASPTKESFLHSLENNKFMTTKPIYLTIEEKDTIFSLDNKNWYLNKNDADKEIQGLKNDYYFDSKINNNTLDINYKMAFSIGKAPERKNPSDGKKIVNLKKGMIFSNSDEKKITTDLKKVILYIPPGTLLSGKVNINGNLIMSQSKSNIVTIKSLQNMFIFIKGKRFSLSFDKINWNLNILSFSIDPKFEIKATSNNQVFFDITATALYEKNKISMSIIKLLLRNL